MVSMHSYELFRLWIFVGSLISNSPCEGLWVKGMRTSVLMPVQHLLLLRGQRVRISESISLAHSSIIFGGSALISKGVLVA